MDSRELSLRPQLCLPSLSPVSSPPPTPHVAPRGPRSVSWSLPDESPYRGSVSYPLSEIRHDRTCQLKIGGSLEENMDLNSTEFLAWRRLHLSKAKLQGISEMAALMAGFSVVATVELQINDDPNPYLLTAFTVTTSLLVCTTMLACTISTCILPHVETVAEMSPNSSAHESPHDRMMFLIELAWVLANTCSIFLFTLDVILLCWIKFAHFSEAASWCATAIMIPVLIAVFVFAIVFYRRLVTHQCQLSEKKYQELEEMKRQLDSPLMTPV